MLMKRKYDNLMSNLIFYIQKCYKSNKRVLLLAVLLSFNSFVFASYVRFIPQTISQPDGTVIHCFTSGDEYYHWLHDSLGYTIVRNVEDGYFYYGVKGNGLIVPSKYKVDDVDPTLQNDLSPWIRLSESEYRKRYNELNELYGYREIPKGNLKSASSERYHEGILNNLVVFIKFKEGLDLDDDLDYYEQIYNGENSLRSYYNEVSYEKLDINSHLFPINEDSSLTILPYEDYHARSFYQPYDKSTNPEGYRTSNEEIQRREALLMNALTFVSNQVPEDLELDKDGDGKIDIISFIIQGRPDGWGDLLWPHRSSINRFSVTINDVQALDYAFQFEDVSLTTLCHEMFHMLGAPDLYHYSYDELTPVGDWDLMERGRGHMGAYMKLKYSDSTWIEELPEIKRSGTYSLRPLSKSPGNVYRFSPKNVNTDEFFVLEYRKKEEDSFDRFIPKSGLLIYRINPNYNGNADGPPDEVYLYRPNGSLTIDGEINNAAYANTSDYVLGKASSPAFLSDGTSSGIKISNVYEIGDSIVFDVELEKSAEAEIKSFFLMGQNKNAIINSNTGIIYSNVYPDTNLKKSKPILSISSLATINPSSGTLIDLSEPFTYTVTAENGKEKEWTLYADSEIFSLSGIDSVQVQGFYDVPTQIDETQKLIDIELPYDADLTNLFLKIFNSPASTLNPDPNSVHDYSEPVTFRVTAEDEVTFTDWTISISSILSSTQDIRESVDYSLRVLVDHQVEITKKINSNALLSVYTIDGVLQHEQVVTDNRTVVKLRKGGIYIILLTNNNSRFQVKIAL